MELLPARAGRLRNENIFSVAEIADCCLMVDGALKVVQYAVQREPAANDEATKIHLVRAVQPCVSQEPCSEFPISSFSHTTTSYNLFPELGKV